MAINNPLIPGDPFSYDLKWIVAKSKELVIKLQEVEDSIPTEQEIISLMEKLLENGDIGYITPETYGAKGDGVTDDSEAIRKALDAAGNVWLPAGHTYFVGETIKLKTGEGIYGFDRFSSKIIAADGVNAIEITNRNTLFNFSIEWSGQAAAIYLYTPDLAFPSISANIRSLILTHTSDDATGFGILFEAEDALTGQAGAYNVHVSDVQMRDGVQYGIAMINNVQTTAMYETWFTEMRFHDIFIQKAECAILSDWVDKSGGNVPHTGDASVNAAISFDRVSAQFTVGFTQKFAQLYNARNVEFSHCTPFDFYRLGGPYIFLNAHGQMCSITFGWQPETSTNFATLLSTFSFLNSSGTPANDFYKVVGSMTVGANTPTTYGNYYSPLLLDAKAPTFNGDYHPLTSPYSDLPVIWGYIQIGQIVFLNACIRATSSHSVPANTNLFNETLPKPMAGQANSVALATAGSTVTNAIVHGSGNIRFGSEYTLNTYTTITAVYLTND